MNFGYLNFYYQQCYGNGKNRIAEQDQPFNLELFPVFKQVVVMRVLLLGHAVSFFKSIIWRNRTNKN